MNTNTVTQPRPVSLKNVKIKKGFWEERQRVNRESTIPAIYNKLEETGRIHAWTLDPDRDKSQTTVVHKFWDSDSGKWLESVGYSLATHPDPDLEKQADALIDLIESAQQSDGYLNSYFPVMQPDGKWANLRDWHELYNAGHLMEAAVAYHQATGKTKLLDVLSRFADLIDEKFGTEEGKQRGYPGHPELEMALVRLAHETGEQKYMDLAKYMIDERGQQPPHYFDIEMEARGERPEDFHQQTYRYCQAHAPIREHDGATGHSVRACYLYAGLADIALETGDEELLDVSRRIWDDLTQHQMYVTGGLGPTNTNEGFTFAYDFPTETAYAETCASIALAFWAHRMFHLDPDSRYIDVMELAIYNGSLSGVSYEGDEFFYANPLASYPNVNPHDRFSGITTDQYYRREEWFFCPCCPPNLSRLVASIGEYSYSQTDDRLYVQLYHENTVDLDINNQSIQLEQTTNYPWDEKISLTVHSESAVSFELALRIPNWCYDYQLTVNGETQTATPEKGYVVLSREWSEGDTVELTLSMPVERVISHPEIRQSAGQIALQRGPIVYCIEEVDNGARLANVIIPDDSTLEASFDVDLFNGVTVITGDAIRIEPEDNNKLYRHRSREGFKEKSFTFKAIPYYLWANRDPGEMRVWVRST